MSTTCIHHNDAQRAAAACPVCLLAENVALLDRAQKAELLANDRDFQLEERLRLERNNAALRAALEAMLACDWWHGGMGVYDGKEKTRIEAQARAALAQGGAK